MRETGGQKQVRRMWRIDKPIGRTADRPVREDGGPVGLPAPAARRCPAAGWSMRCQTAARAAPAFPARKGACSDPDRSAGTARSACIRCRPEPLKSRRRATGARHFGGDLHRDTDCRHQRDPPVVFPEQRPGCLSDGAVLDAPALRPACFQSRILGGHIFAGLGRLLREKVRTHLPGDFVVFCRRAGRPGSSPRAMASSRSLRRFSSECGIQAASAVPRGSGTIRSQLSGTTRISLAWCFFRRRPLWQARGWCSSSCPPSWRHRAPHPPHGTCPHSRPAFRAW